MRLLNTKISGGPKQNTYNLTKLLLINKIILNNKVKDMVVNQVKEEINGYNIAKHQLVCLFYQLSSFYNLSGFKNKSLDYIYRWFTIIAKTKNFQQLDFNSVNKILSSSELNISSELEVFNASDFWLSCESFNRSKFTKELFLKTRFPLLSDHVTISLLKRNKDSSDNTFFHKIKECLVLVEEVLKNKEEFTNTSQQFITKKDIVTAVCMISCYAVDLMKQLVK